MILLEILHSLGAQVQSVNDVAVTSVTIDMLWFVSLVTAFCSASAALLGKQWIREYIESSDPEVSGGRPRAAARNRHYLYQGLFNGQFSSNFLLGVSGLIHLSILFFLVGLIPFLWTRNSYTCIVVCGYSGVGVLFYIFATFKPIFVAHYPFRTPITPIMSSILHFLFGWTKFNSSRHVSRDREDFDASAIGWLLASPTIPESVAIAVKSIPLLKGTTQQRRDIVQLGGDYTLGSLVRERIRDVVRGQIF